ncbi:TNF receptor-associated factor 6 [Ahaetulla prasina]|uniref:TNF receptor-associated factor 6 n=1 Tax=Ahaetulla prasina TaxID=499056 RepID=UPI002648D2C5|nr:TNF receptor-associated factor 6 [Ahaetulla prasina]XP_058017660.1 TNF receptor-associated factor 6 [Ahaetulla prasina]XP_058017661.1 TNF receptor-associated factor 6 [Ahaetulla prasina]
MSLLHSNTSFEINDQESDCCAAMASACSAGTKEESFTAPISNGTGGTLSNSFMEETQGYDVEFDPPLESKYECPICLMALREAVQTPCGHRFCKACIVKSIRDAGHKCPIDNEILLENQLFPDNFAKREILSLTVKCPNKGCSQKMELRHLEDHQLHCGFASEKCSQCQGIFQKNQLQEHIKLECPRRQIACPNCAMCMPYEEKRVHDEICLLANVFCEYCNTVLIREQLPNHYDNDCPTAPVPCTYSAFGCLEKMQRNDLAHHVQEFTQVHMRMMAQTLRSISVTTPTSMNFSGTLPFDPSLFSQGMPPSCECSPEVQNFKETIQQLEGRLVRQDHQIRELIAKMETQHSQMGDLKRTIRTLEEKIADIEAQQCNGIFLWKIENFSAYLKAQEEERPVVIHSPGFYTGKPGYKLCLRLHIQLPSAQRCANYISLFVHTMQGDYDSHLPWPFQGTIRLSILDQSEGSPRHNHEEVMDTKPELLAFQRPMVHRNPKGFGYVTFMQLQALKQRTYIKDDILLVRCEVLTRLDLTSLRREGFQPRSTDGTS